MPWPFPSKPSPEDRAVALDVIRHLQTQAALQQLAMETYNTALALASSVAQKGDEVFVRPVGLVSDPARAANYLLPALEKKVAIAEAMTTEHQAFPFPLTPRKAREAYDRCTDFLDVFLARARLQLTCWKLWVDDPSRDLRERLAHLDEAEDQSMTVAIDALNDLIQSAGISAEAWMSLNWAAFNDARSRVGMPPLTKADFRARFSQGIAGGRPRFFE